MRMRYPRKVVALRMAKDALFFFLIWHRNHFGFRPRSALEGLACARKLARAGKEYRQPPIGKLAAGRPKSWIALRPNSAVFL